MQAVITLLQEEKFGLPLQFKNFRDWISCNRLLLLALEFLPGFGFHDDS
ncbi:MAG: hypothetical protein IIB78_09490 [Proteobacteria bacterium]|nr:hypothetical protein [Pseudomonadota bacterium]MCH8058089.1 hypothetical protein [Pseudomonadota bacterium]